MLLSLTIIPSSSTPKHCDSPSHRQVGILENSERCPPPPFGDIASVDNIDSAAEELSKQIKKALENSKFHPKTKNFHELPFKIRNKFNNCYRIRRLWQQYRPPADREEMNRLSAEIKREVS